MTGDPGDNLGPPPPPPLPEAPGRLLPLLARCCARTCRTPQALQSVLGPAVGRSPRGGIMQPNTPRNDKQHLHLLLSPHLQAPHAIEALMLRHIRHRPCRWPSVSLPAAYLKNSDADPARRPRGPLALHRPLPRTGVDQTAAEYPRS